MFPRIEQENLFAHYDPTKQMVCVVIFNQSIQTDLFVTIHKWIEDLLDKKLDVHAILMDFRHIRTFRKSEDLKMIELDSERYETLMALPIVLIVDNLYQENKLKAFLEDVSQIQNKHIVQSYVSAFDHIDSFHKIENVKQDEYSISTKQASLWADIETHFIYIIYYGVVTAQATADVYGRMFGNLDMIGVENIKAGLFEFRHVSKFDNSNLQSVKRSSTTINKQYDMSNIAVSLIVGNFHQEQMVRLAMKVSPQEERKKIVFSLTDSYQFIEDFHKKREAKLLSDT